MPTGIGRDEVQRLVRQESARLVFASSTGVVAPSAATSARALTVRFSDMSSAVASTASASDPTTQ